MQVCISVDVESDCPPYLSGYRGVEHGLPALLELFEREAIPATFFCTGDVARRYPEAIRAVVAAGLELGCHGDTHQRLDRLPRSQARREIRRAAESLRRFAPVVSFRAPHLLLPTSYLSLVAEAGFRVDSSAARYKRSPPVRWEAPAAIARAPASITSSALRLPRAVRYPFLRRLPSPVVLFVHPWEFVDLRRERLRLDCRFRTGLPALRALGENIRFYKRLGAQFARVADLTAPA